MGVPAVRDAGAAQEGPSPRSCSGLWLCCQGFIHLGFENLGGGKLQNSFGEPFNIKTTKSGHPPSVFFCPLIHMTPGIPYSLKYFPLTESPQYWVKIQSQMVHNSEEANRRCRIYERPGKSYFCNKQCLNNTLATGFLLFNDQTVEVYNYHGFLSI